MSVVEFFSQPVWHRLGLTLVHFLWQGLAVAVIAYAAVRVLSLKRGNPRYAAYLLAFTIIAVCPLITFTVLGVPAKATFFAPGPLPVLESSGPVPRSVVPEPPEQLSESTVPVGPTHDAPLRERLDGMLQASLPWMLVCWMGGVLMLSVRLLLGFIGVRRWRRNLEPLADGLETRVALLSERLGMAGFSRVFVSRQAMEAVALGYLRPMVLLPAAMLTRMDPAMIEAVVAHELAHIRRLDLWVNLAQRVVETLLFYHPAVWWLSNHLRAERELCCDELAVKATGERLTYASALESAGRTRLAARRPSLALALGQAKRSTLNRVRHILGLTPTPPDSRFWLAGIVSSLVLLLLAMPTVPLLTATAQTQPATENPQIAAKSLIEAAAAGDVDQVKLLISNGADVNEKDKDGRTPLHSAAREGEMEAVKLLVEAGADLNCTDKDGQTPASLAMAEDHKGIVELLVSKGADVSLHVAAYLGDLARVRSLVDKGADIEEVRLGVTPLFQSLIKRFNKEVAAFLLDKGANPNSTSNNNATLLHEWAWGGDIDLGVSIIEFLIERGANVNALQGESRWTPLHSACSQGRPKIAEVLIKHGANIEAKDRSGQTPLHYAIENEHLDTVRALAAKGVDVTSAQGYGSPLLHYAVWNDDLEIVKLCMDHGADFNAKDQAGWTAFRYAVSSGSRRVFEFFVSKGANASKFHTAAWLGDLTRVKGFVEQGADVNEKDEELGWTPLHWAAFTGPQDVIEFLIARGANVNARDAWDDTPLHRAAAAGQKESVELFLAKGAKVNAEGESGKTPLHDAARKGHEEVVGVLIAGGADLNARDGSGLTPLLRAVLKKHLKAVELLVAKGADVNAMDKGGRTPLDYIGQQHHAEIVDLLRKHGATHSLLYAVYAGDIEKAEELIAQHANVNLRDEYRRTPLHGAVQIGRSDMAELLISKGADINAKTESNQTPLHYACGSDNKDMVELLLSRGADVHARTQYDSAPIHYAAGLGSSDMVERLLAAGADLNATTGGRTPLYIAICANRSKTVELLAAKGAQISPIHLAAFLGNSARVKTLIEGGADANARDGAGFTPLHNAVCGDSKDVVTLLIEQGADINATGWRQWTPLHHASDVGHTDMVEVLIDHGAKVDLRGENGNTPLLLAAGKGHIDVVRRLVAKGADVNTRGDRESTPGSTPLHIASKNGHKAVVELLLTNGANVNAKTDEGHTPLSLARDKGHAEIVELLRQHGAKE